MADVSCAAWLCCPCLQGILSVQGYRKPGLGEDLRQTMIKSTGGRDRIRFLLNPALSSRRIDDVYEGGKQIGAGAFGTVERRVHKQTQQCRAVKQIRWTSVWHGRSKNDENERLIKRELQTLIQLDHPNIAHFHEWFEDPHGGIFFVMDLCEGGTLGELLEDMTTWGLDERLAHKQHLQGLMRQLCYATSYMHGQGVAHRDLKPANVLLSGEMPNQHTKLIDFGLANLVQGGDADNTPVGTLEFMAPELFLGSESANCADKGDVWALGIMFASMVTAMRKGELRHPYIADAATEKAKIYYQLFCAYRSSEPWDRELFQGEPASAFEFADRVFRLDPQSRASAAELLHTEWIAESGESAASLAEGQIGQHLHDLKGWARLGSFDRTVLSLAAAHTQNVPRMESLTKAFWACDEDKDGKLSREELRRGFHATGRALSDEELDDIFEALDLDVADGIDFGQFLAATVDESYLQTPEVIDSTFHSLDFQQRGELLCEDLSSAFGADESDLPLQKISRHDFGLLMGRIAERREAESRSEMSRCRAAMMMGKSKSI